MIVNSKPHGAPVLLYRPLYKNMGLRAVTPTGNKLKVTRASHLRPGELAKLRITSPRTKAKKVKIVTLSLRLRRTGVTTVFHNFVTGKTVANVPLTEKQPR